MREAENCEKHTPSKTWKVKKKNAGGGTKRNNGHSRKKKYNRKKKNTARQWRGGANH